jgi:RNA polymerase sigma-70 factor (ECF subfamily)
MDLKPAAASRVRGRVTAQPRISVVTMAVSSEEPGREPARPVELEERRLLPRHCRGDAEAFGELLAAYRAPVYGYLVRSGVENAVRDDLFQEVFMKVHAAAPNYQPSRPLAPWIFTIVANTVRSHFRKHKVRGQVWSKDPAPEVAGREPDPEELATAGETAAWLTRAIEELPLPQREVVLLCCVEGMSGLETATALGIPANTVKTHLRRARLALARDLARRDDPARGREER